MSPLHPGYYGSDELRQLGFARVGEDCAIARNCTVVGVENITLSDHVRIDGYTTIVAVDGKLQIGTHVHVCSGCVIGARGGVTLGDFSSLSHHVCLLSATDDFTGQHMTNSTLPSDVLGVTTAPIEVGAYVPVGSGALVLPGSRIGEGAAVHAHSVVAGILPSWTICGGNPAVPVGARSKQLLDQAAHMAGRAER